MSNPHLMVAYTMSACCMATFVMPLAYASDEVVPASMTAADESSVQLFLQCADVSMEAARLACYDKVARGGKTTILATKQPLDLAKTVQASIKEGKPKVVLAGSDEVVDAATDILDTPTTDATVHTLQQIPTQDAKTQTGITKSNNSDVNSSVDKDTPVNVVVVSTDPNLQHKVSVINGESGIDNSIESNKIDNSIESNKDDNGSAILTKIGITQNDIGRYTPLSLTYDLDKNSEQGIWSARPHNALYILPVYLSDNPNRHPSTPTQEQVDYTDNEMRDIELKAQISVKTKMMEDVFGTNADLWFGYTQKMYWQVYNEDNSRPFRAIDYQPEIFLTQPVRAELPLNGRLRMLGVGALHHSNGQSDPLSRSWNRLYVMGGTEWNNLTIIPRVWMHVKAKTTSKPSDNPDIIDYYGQGDVKVLYDMGQGKSVSATGRYNFATQKGALELGYSHPFANGVEGFVQLFHGYGESIIDYNHKSTNIGVGITLNDWEGL